MRHFMMIFVLYFILTTLAVADEAIGRLFFTPEQRQHLERLRVDNQLRTITTETNSETRTSVSAMPDMKTQGYVKRNDGKKSTRWVNGKPVQTDVSHVFE